LTTVSANSSALLQQIQSLASTLQSDSAGQSSSVGNFMQALEQVLTAGEQVLSANLSQPTASTTTQSTASQASSTGAISTTPSTASAPSTSSADDQTSVYTPTTAWSQASWDTSPYDAADNAAANGVSQLVNGVQIIPNAPGWDASSPELQSIYSGIQSTWDSEAATDTAQVTQSSSSSSSTSSSSGPYGWATSAYNAANNAAASGVSQLVNGVQVIPGAPGWDPNNPALQSIYTGMQGTWNTLNSVA
jgi:hypothetical protein